MTTLAHQPPLTGLLAEFAAGAKASDLPSPVVERARLHVLDTLGVTLAGCVEPQATIPAHVFFAADGAGEISVIGRRERLSASNAAVVNGAAAHALDYDDWQHPWYGHPSAVFVPALFALGELRGSSGARVIAAYSVAMATGHALAVALQPAHQKRGWHSTGTLGAIAAAAGCANLLGLDAAQTRNAIALGATQAAGVHQNFGTMAKPLHAGFAARAGVVSALLAEGGFDAGAEMIDGKLGFAEVYSRGDRFDDAAFRAAFEDPFGGSFAGLSVKPYPSCGATHPPLDAILGLIAAHDVRAEEVVRVDGVVSSLAALLLSYLNPDTGLQGKFSFEYCMAVALLDRRAGLAQFTDKRASDPRLAELMTRVSKVADDAVDPKGDFSSRVSLTLRDGRTLTEYVTIALGTTEKPLGAAEVEDKFRECAGVRMQPANIEEVIELMRSFETASTVRSVTNAVRDGLKD